MSTFSDIFGMPKPQQPDQTAERVADATELTAAIAALRFYEENNDNTDCTSPACQRLKKLVARFTERLCKRHGV